MFLMTKKMNSNYPAMNPLSTVRYGALWYITIKIIACQIYYRVADHGCVEEMWKAGRPDVLLYNSSERKLFCIVYKVICMSPKLNILCVQLFQWTFSEQMWHFEVHGAYPEKVRASWLPELGTYITGYFHQGPASSSDVPIFVCFCHLLGLLT